METQPGGPVIPEGVIVRPPSAELRDNQTDQDSLPPYEVLDAILKLYIEEWKEVDEIAAKGFDKKLVERILKLVDTNEFKRRQAAPTSASAEYIVTDTLWSNAAARSLFNFA